MHLQIDRTGTPLEARFIEHLAPLLRIRSKASPAFEEQEGRFELTKSPPTQGFGRAGRSLRLFLET